MKKRIIIKKNYHQIRGQGYDGAASMSGRFNGIAAKTCYNLFNTPKRQQFFLTHLDKLKQNESSYQKQKLNRLCPTRWIKRYNSIETFYEFFPAILNCLEEIIM
jgi:hypothetical protein